jgi:Mlc titration factor MtfA (ptsG expression regulator)
MLAWLRRLLPRGLPGSPVAQSTVPDALWQGTLARYPFLANRSAGERAHLRELTGAFLARKEFHGAGGLVVTDAMAVAVAAQACLPLLHLAAPDRPQAALAWYDDFVGIVLHPGEVLARREVMDEDGVVHHYRETLSGEAMEGGPVMLSWADVSSAGETAAQGYNVVIHEFTHKLDMRDGEADGCPPLPAGFRGAASARAARRHWLAVMVAEHQRFAETVQAAERFAGLVEPTWLDPYAAESVSEFFAVAAEAYFVNPARLAADFPAVHDLLAAFFGGPAVASER